MPPYLRKYKLPHEVLPYELELSLPENVVDHIYSFLRRRKDPNFIKIQRLSISLNHKITALQKLREEKLRRLRERKKQDELRKELLNKLEMLAKLLQK